MTCKNKCNRKNKSPNFILMADSYKVGHHKLYPKNTTTIFSYLESRGGVYDETVFFGLQYYLMKYLDGVVVTQEMVDDADKKFSKVFGTISFFNRAGWERIVNVHGGRLPIKIRAVKEGMVVKQSNVLMTVENTDPQIPWITNYVETLLMKLWYPITVASRQLKNWRTIKKYADITGTTVSPFHINDFGYRGVSSEETAKIGGSAHLLSFSGTDTLTTVDFIEEFYNGDICGFSVMATEHSTTTIYGKENEATAMRNAIIAAGEEAVVSIVIDSYDTINELNNIIGEQLRDLIVNRSGKVVVRPDSGDPVEMSVICLEALWNKFGGTKNEKGFKVLNPRVGVIYGDGINDDSINDILFAVVKAGFCVSNIVFGMGGALLQKCDRDTNKFAFKCCYGVVDGNPIDVYKDPVTDTGKRSKRGRIKLVDIDGNLVTTRIDQNPLEDVLEDVFVDGKIVRYQTFDEIKKILQESR